MKWGQAEVKKKRTDQELTRKVLQGNGVGVVCKFGAKEKKKGHNGRYVYFFNIPNRLQMFFANENYSIFS